MKKSIAAIVVTYNRKELLFNCLNAIFDQSHSVNAIYIIDNKSSDGTPEYLVEKKIIRKLPILDSNTNENYSEVRVLENGNRVTVNYIRKSNNDGGAGGFYEGMKTGYEAGFEWLWLMDDDGEPDDKQLECLLQANNETSIEYLNALVVNIGNKNILAFGLKNYKLIEDIKEERLIVGEANPFNGTLISRKIIQQVGFVKKEMFIWGDESEYLSRVKKNNFEIATIISARHNHPQNKGVSERVIPFLKSPSVLIKPTKLSHIYFRNQAYLFKEYGTKKQVIYTYLVYALYFVVRLDFKSFFSFTKNFKKGLDSNFS